MLEGKVLATGLKEVTVLLLLLPMLGLPPDDLTGRRLGVRDVRCEEVLSEDEAGDDDGEIGDRDGMTGARRFVRAWIGLSCLLSFRRCIADEMTLE